MLSRSSGLPRHFERAIRFVVFRSNHNPVQSRIRSARFSRRARELVSVLHSTPSLMRYAPLLKLQPPGDHPKSNLLPFNCTTLMCCKEGITHACVVRFPASPPGLVTLRKI